MDVVKLGTLTNRKIGYGIVQPGACVPNGVPVIKVNNIISGLNNIYDLETTSIENDVKYKRTKLVGGELIISVVGTIGKTAIVPPSFAGCNLVRATCLIDIRDELLTSWVKYYIDSPIGQHYIHENLNTTVQPTLNVKSLVDMPIPMYSTEYMKDAVSILKSLDDKFEVNRRINDNLKQQAQAMFKSWFVDFEPFKKQSFVESELGMIPKDWKVGKIGDYCKVRSGFAFKSSWWTDKGKKVIKIKNITDGGKLNMAECSYVSDINARKAHTFKTRKGDLLIAMTGATIGKFCIVDTDENYYVNQRVGKFILGDEPLMKLPFIYCILQKTEVIKEIIGRGQGSAQPNISGNDIESIIIAYPPDEIISHFNKKTFSIFEMIIKNELESRSLAKLRDTLLPSLMSGELKENEVGI
jgi:type I restriction enzyme S subunit